MLEKIRDLNKKQIILSVAFCIALIIVSGYIIQMVISRLASISSNEPFSWFQPGMLLRASTYTYGVVVVLGVVVFYVLNHMDGWLVGRNMFGKPGTGNVESVLENSRFMNEKEIAENFPGFTYENAGSVKKDGVPIRAVLDKKGELRCNFMSGAHSLIIGATGSGKTTTFINPMIQLLGAAGKGSSMIMTDPKGELFQLHSAYLVSKGYKVRILDLRDTYSSDRWNPLSSIYDMYQEYLRADREIIMHQDRLDDYPDLRRMDDDSPSQEGFWIEYRGLAYTDCEHCLDDISVTKQKIYDELYEDLNDLVSVLCPITNEKEPLWEKGARSIVMATCLAMLEDSADPALGMTRERFNFYNVNRILTKSDNNFEALKQYFAGRSEFSQAVTLSRQVLTAAEQTMSSYMSITFDKLTMFNDQGICGLTSATDIRPEDISKEPTALFIKIPDEKDTRHGLAAMFILCIYKALIKTASASEELTLPRNVYFILDEFGNMPRIEKFDKMITVGRSRKIWFNMVVQSYSQLNNVYGEQIADIIKSNCAMKMFIGSNDIGTCKEFSELCGNTTVKVSSVSASTSGKDGEKNISTQVQTRPLIYPSELQKLNNKTATGNAIIVTFGNYPLKTQFTPSYKCDYYKSGCMDMSAIRNRMFRPEEVFYDIDKRNKAIVGSGD